MGYLNQFETELARQLEQGGDTASIVKWVSGKVLESYKNGLVAGRKGETVIRQGASRKRDLLPKAH